jgi:hypothetical protein
MVSVSALAILASSCKQRSYNTSDTQDSFAHGGENKPALFEVFGKLDYNFDTLKTKLKGELDNQPWSDTYWPNSEGGITVRWRTHSENERYNYKSPKSPEEIEAMAASNPESITNLSPAEKFDIITGGYRKGWPLWKREAAMTSSCPLGLGVAQSRLPVRTAPAGLSGGDSGGDWEGKCHAWTPAALHFPEPATADVEVTGANGKKFTVHFGSSDIKALLIVAYDMYLNQYPDYARVGKRCEKNYEFLGQGSRTPCLDTNAGTFFVLATNLLQPGKPGFVIDYDQGQQVWNQPAWRYTHTIKEGTCPVEITNPARRDLKVAHVVTELEWIGELEASETPHGKENRVETVSYEYCVEIEAKTNKVVGGSWVGTKRPDFIWMSGKPDFNKVVTDTRTGMQFDLRPLLALYQKSRAGSRTGR